MNKNCNVYVISAGRAEALPFSENEKKAFVFCVPKGQAAAYEQAGCPCVFETGSLIDSRNWALDNAFAQGKICVQLSDDLNWVKLNKNFGQSVKLDLLKVLESLCNVFQKVPTLLMGVPPTNNSFYAQKLVSVNTFCVGDCFFVKPSSPRFDKNLTLKEDYDFTLQYIFTQQGGCFRYQKYVFDFKHQYNKGGVCDFRNKEKEQKNILYLMQKWGENIKINPKRENEILLKIKNK
jgi:hypothetical protein